MSAKIKTRRRSHRHAYRPKGVPLKRFERVYWPYLPLILIISGLLMFGIGRGGLQFSLSHPGGHVLAYANSMEPSKLLADTNAERQINQDSALSLNSKLEAAAQAKASDMAARDYWSHYTPDNQPPWIFVTAQNYTYDQLGENLATGFANESSVVNAWMQSPEHRKNMLNPSFSDVGFGVARSANYTAAGGGPMTIVVAFYGQPASTSIVQSASIAPTSPSQTSHAQLAFAPLPSGPITVAIWSLLTGAIGIWVGKHLRQVRRSLKHGEKFVITHPMLDACLIVIAGIAYLLTQTAGYIR